MDNEVDIGPTRVFPLGQVVRVEIGEKACALARGANGEISIFEDNCPHLQMPIADGRVEDSFIVCPWHGAYFDIETGESHSPLAIEPLKKLASRVVEDRVLCQRED